MEIVNIIFRILHIFGAVAWVGGAWMVVFFIEPTVRALGPDGGKFMGYMATVRRYPIYVMGAALITLIAGFALYGAKWGQVWNTGPGLTFLIGGLIGVVGGVMGGMTGAVTGRLMRLGGEITGQQKPPSPEQQAQMAGFQERLRTLGRITAVLVSVALLLMAVARYMTFF